MIAAFIGSPGSGKSTALSWVAEKAVRGKRVELCGVPLCPPLSKVFTNFPFPGAYQLDYDNLGSYDYSGSLILLDEASLYADSRDFKSFSKKEQFFFTQHRKFEGCNIIWASQNYDDVDKKIRSITTQYFLVELCGIPFMSNFSCITCVDAFTRVEDRKIVSGYEMTKSRLINRKRLYKLFDSYSCVGADKPTQDPPLIKW